jgi:hypothetical protein
MAVKPPKPVKRTIYVMHLQVWDAHRTAVEPDQGIIWAELEKMPYRTSAGLQRVQAIAGQDRAVRVAVLGNGQVHGDFSACKYDDNPRKKDHRERVGDLNLAADEGLNYPAHFHIQDLTHCPVEPAAPSSQPMSLLYWENAYGSPKVPSLASYLNELFHDRYHIEIAPAVHPEPWDLLLSEEKVGRIRARVGIPEDPTGHVFEAAFRRAPPDVAMLEVFFRPGKRKKMALGGAIPLLKELQATDDVDRLDVERRHGHILDLLSHKLKFYIQVPPVASRSRKHVDRKAILEELRRLSLDSRATLAAGYGRRWVAKAN